MKYRDAFTLIEVMLATVILSVGMVVLLTAASRCLAVMKNAKQYQEAQWALGQGEVDFPLSATNDVKDLACGPEEYPNGCIYQRVVEDDDDEDDLYLVRITVTWQERDRERREEVVRYVYFKEE